ncbi:MAG TPA: sn-glycerol-3-phosphate ABC transporter ATP-binding protein UgpC [Thermoanaerobaculia bacterium]|jgi:multiple sugar transport system ATP-binding protein|nr:sn-glycerol-3-phosphate ABC transporter ATP-binding protein UgpC [Thermoanaerobaculia bacterium]
MAEVTFDHVKKSYGPVTVIEDLNLEIRDKEFMVLVGPSGCGKSTALRMIAGLEEISAGTVSIGGRVVNDVAPKDRDIAMVFQSYALYPHMTVRENLQFGLKIRKTPRAEMDRLVNEAAGTLGITEYLDRKPKQLSGGQRQRVALGRAIVRKPAVFLFDEPLSNLDAKLRVQMRAEITKLQKGLQTTTVYVTHDQIEAMTMGHRIAVMKAGKLQQVGTPLEVYEKPANLFVAGFIGTPPMNFVPAVVSDGGSSLTASGFKLPVPEPLRPATNGKDGLKVVMGIRPENVREAARGEMGSTARVHGRVDFVEPLGHEVIVHAKVGDELLVAKADPHRVPEMGSEMDLEIELNALHLFDAASEQRLSSKENLQ